MEEEEEVKEEEEMKKNEKKKKEGKGRGRRRRNIRIESKKSKKRKRRKRGEGYLSLLTLRGINTKYEPLFFESEVNKVQPRFLPRGRMSSIDIVIKVDGMAASMTTISV